MKFYMSIDIIFVSFCYGHIYLHMVYFLCKVEKNFLSPHASRKGDSLCQKKRVVIQKHKPKQALKYLAEKVEDIRIRVPKGQKAVIKGSC